MIWMIFAINLASFKRDAGYPIINYIVPHLAWVFHLAALSSYTGITNLMYEDKDECDNKDFDVDDKLDL
jgi:hypothetical protein